MISFFKRLMRDRRGNALMIGAAALPLVLGSAGLATDTIQWALWKRQLQRAADSAAFAGVYAKFQEGSAQTAVTRDLNNNNHLWASLLSGFPQVSEPADTTTQRYIVEVSLAAQQRLGFSSLFMSAAPVIRVTGRAAAMETDDFCVVALENTNESGIIIQGSSTVNLGCGMISNSRSATASVVVNGVGHIVTAEPVAGAGVVQDVNGVTDEESYHIPQPDPYEGLYSTDIPAGEPCRNRNQHVVSTVGNTTTLSPGCYSGAASFKFTGGDYVLQPGVYYLDSIDFNITGGSVTGDGVTIILTGSNPGQVNMNGNGTVDLTAPTSGPYAKLLLMQSAAATNINNTNTLNGTASSAFDGTIYFPNQQVTFSGNAGSMTKCAMVVARRVEFSGNTNIQNNTVGCQANSTVMGWRVRLVA